MNLYKRANGYWYVDYEQNGKRIQKSTKSKLKKDALLFLSAFQEQPKKHSQSLFPLLSMNLKIFQESTKQAKVLKMILEH